jgi:uncharacterized membrane protein YfcA
MELTTAFIIIVTGFVAGFINVVSGGGSLLSLPILIFSGLPPVVANASNRIAVIFESLSGTAGYRSKGVSAFPYSFWLGISALGGAIIGASIAVDIKDEIFNRILAIIMVCVVGIVIFKPSYKNEDQEQMGINSRLIAFISFFFIGIYGGFIQAGAGFLIISALSLINKFSLLKSNSAKTLIVLIYSSAALAVFIYEGKVNWTYGLTLAIGNASGAWVSSRLSVRLGEKWIKGFMIVSVTALAVKLWLYH